MGAALVVEGPENAMIKARERRRSWMGFILTIVMVVS